MPWDFFPYIAKGIHALLHANVSLICIIFNYFSSSKFWYHWAKLCPFFLAKLLLCGEKCQNLAYSFSDFIQPSSTVSFTLAKMKLPPIFLMLCTF